jgi:hypothetical protein
MSYGISKNCSYKIEKFKGIFYVRCKDDDKEVMRCATLSDAKQCLAQCVKNKHLGEKYVRWCSNVHCACQDGDLCGYRRENCTCRIEGKENCKYSN